MAFRHRRLLCKLKAVVDPFKKPDSDSDPLREPCGPPPVKQHHVATVLVLSIGLAAAALLLLSCLALRRYRSRRRSSSPWADTRSNREDFTDALREPPIDHPVWYIRTIGLPQSVVDSIEKLRYEKGEGLIETGDCAVCLSEFEEGESLRLLPKCSHAFHVACIDTWLRSHSNCPLCRAPILGNRTSPAESSESEGIQVASESMIESRPAVLGVEDDRVINMIGQEMEAVSRSVSLDYFSAKNSFRTDRSTSFDIKITSSSNHETGSIGQSF